jgi:hypothetical protein
MSRRERIHQKLEKPEVDCMRDNEGSGRVQGVGA